MGRCSCRLRTSERTRRDGRIRGIAVQKPLDILKKHWGYDSFRGIQRDIIESILGGCDTLGLMPTGGGKSICFQVPALMMEGLCIVVTPLISLMKDQVQQLKQRGIRAEAVYSGMMHDDIVRVLDNAVLGAYRLLYISPERLSSELFMLKLRRMRHVSMIVVDEAHCISQWGYDFRPSYLQIAKIRQFLPCSDVPVLALTATATPKVVDDIQERLGFREKNVFSMSFERKNLIYVVRETEDRAGEMLHILQGVPNGSAIVYTRTRQQTIEIARFLEEKGITASHYHAGLTNAEKDYRQINWTKNRVRVMVATNAFGMGIDKPDVRLVIHYNMPDSLEAYFQEAGRAGRDGKASYAVLLYNRQDLKTLNRRVPETYPDIDYVRQTYENVSCFLQVGVGEALGRTFYFPMETFCRAFHQFPVQTHAALHLLNNAGYIEYHEEQEFKSALHFILRKEELYRIYETSEETDLLIQTILRTYSGVFANYVYIEETNLSHLTGIPVQQVYQMLKDLHHNRIIDFIPHRQTPTVGYTIARVDTEFISLPPIVYEDRKADFQQRIDEIARYVTSTDTCRSRMLRNYFGERTNHDCGQCDVCLARKKAEATRASDVQAAVQAITAFLQDGNAHKLAELKTLPIPTPVFDEAVRYMTTEELLVTQGMEVALNHQS
ncbi:MAG: RecQ family ATP-dependent DNA helicase [Bacteroidaceae bacterium]|nr:RecQ family ATP-dependent DNA helicase [Bacteroidaceae bacterium]